MKTKQKNGARISAINGRRSDPYLSRLKTNAADIVHFT
jgi:hypothetical protein